MATLRGICAGTILSLAFASVASAGFDVTASYYDGSVYVRNRGYGGMFGPGVNTGTTLDALKFTYSSSYAAKFNVDYSWDDGEKFVDIPNAQGNFNNFSRILIGSALNTQVTAITPAVSNEWLAIKNFSVDLASERPVDASGFNGLQIAKINAATAGSTFFTVSGTLKGNIGPAVDYTTYGGTGVFADGAYFDQLSYVSTIAPAATANNFVAASGYLTGFIPGAYTLSAADLPSFVSFSSTSNGTYGPSFQFRFNRALTSRDAGIYTARVLASDGSPYGLSANVTLVIVPEPITTSVIGAGTLLVWRRRR